MRIELSTRQLIFTLLFILLGAYAVFQARFIILGPHVSISSPLDGAHADSPLVEVTGHAENIAYISLDDRPIFVDGKGDFKEKLIVPQGLSIMTLRARDRFGRQTEKQVRIIYNK